MWLTFYCVLVFLLGGTSPLPAQLKKVRFSVSAPSIGQVFDFSFVQMALR